MNDNKKKQSPLGIVIALLLIGVSLARGLDDADDFLEILPFLLMALVFVVIFVALTAAAKKMAQKQPPQGAGQKPSVELHRPFPEPQNRRTPAIFAHKGETAAAEDAIHCAHSRGKEKYLEQIDGYLKNGIIDREEYKLLKKRYESLEIPEDYH